MQTPGPTTDPTTDPKRVLEIIFKSRTTFNVRFKKSWWKDWIAPGLYQDEFLEEYTKAELNQLLRDGFIKKTVFRDEKGMRRAALIFTGYEMPQTDPFKKNIEALRGFSRKLRGLSTLFSLKLTVWLRILFFIGLGVAVLASVPWKKAWGFADSVVRARPLTEGLPYESEFGYFDDTPQKIRCYWLEKLSEPTVALSCVGKN